MRIGMRRVDCLPLNGNPEVVRQTDAMQKYSLAGQRVPLGTIKLSKLKACVNRLEIPIFYCIDDCLLCNSIHLILFSTFFRIFSVDYNWHCFRFVYHVSPEHHGIVLCSVWIENIGCSLPNASPFRRCTRTSAFYTHTIGADKRFEWILRVNKQLLLENDSHLIYFIANYLFVVCCISSTNYNIEQRTLFARRE